MKAKLLKLVFVSLGFMFFVGCEKEPDDIGPDHTERMKQLAEWLDSSVLRDVVDNLDYLFAVSAHRDSLLCGGDAEIVIRHHFSHPSLGLPVFNDDGEISMWRSGAINTVTHNGKSLNENGAEWIVTSTRNRIWISEQQPEKVESEWIVRRENDKYTLSGEMNHNGLYQEYFVLSDISEITFTTSIVRTTVMSDAYGQEKKNTLYCCLDGDMDVRVIKRALEDHIKPNLSVTLQKLEGYNGKIYVDGYPVFGGEEYFEGGRMNVLVLDEDPSWSFTAGFSRYGKAYTLVK